MRPLKQFLKGQIFLKMSKYNAYCKTDRDIILEILIFLQTTSACDTKYPEERIPILSSFV